MREVPEQDSLKGWTCLTSRKLTESQDTFQLLGKLSHDCICVYVCLHVLDVRVS